MQAPGEIYMWVNFRYTHRIGHPLFSGLLFGGISIASKLLLILEKTHSRVLSFLEIRQGVHYMSIRGASPTLPGEQENPVLRPARTSSMPHSHLGTFSKSGCFHFQYLVIVVLMEEHVLIAFSLFTIFTTYADHPVHGIVCKCFFFLNVLSCLGLAY